MEFTRHYLDGLPTILVVAADGRRSVLVTALDDLDGYEVETVVQGATAPDRIDERTSCVVLSGEYSETTGVEMARRIAEAWPHLPIVLCPETIDETVVRATGSAVDAIVPAADLDRLITVVRGHADDYLRIRSKELKADAYDSLFDTVDDTIFIKNDRAEHLKLATGDAGPSHDEALGKTEAELHDSRFNLGSQWYDDDMAVLDGEEIIQAVNEYGDGEISFHLEETRLPWRDEDGEIRGIVGHSRNVSDRVGRREELERTNERLDQFTRYVTHDLQNPLQVADGYLELAMDGEDDALEKIGDALHRMERLIEDIRILAKGEAERDTEAHPVDFVDVVTTVWQGVKTETATLEIDVPDGTILHAAEHEFRPLTENLLKNAIQHGGEASSVRVGTFNGGFYVADDGPGVPPEERDEIFEQGFTTSRSGTGTGLAIVSDVADSHDWRLEVTESDDGGARFDVRNVLLVRHPDRRTTPGRRIELAENTDVGGTIEPGSATYDESEDCWTISGSGADIWGEENEFHYVYATVEGDVRIEGRVVDVEEINSFSKAGFMVRDSLEELAPHGYIGSTASKGTELLWRDEAGGRTTSQHLDKSDNGWFRLDREGDLLTCYASGDGTDWQPVDQRRVPLADDVYVGLAVSSVIPRSLCTATFKSVRVNQLESGA